MASPTQEELRYWRDQGCIAEVVEHHNYFSGKKTDFLGCIDLIAVSICIIGVQVTSHGNHAARVKKCCEEPRVKQWLQAGGHLVVASWGKGKTKREDGRWIYRRDTVITLGMLTETPPE